MFEQISHALLGVLGIVWLGIYTARQWYQGNTRYEKTSIG